jgi:hypothetical protein
MDFIKDFLEQYYPYVLALFAGGTSFFIPLTREIWIIILRAFITKKAIIRVFIHLGDYAVKQIPGTIDDELWAEAKKALIEELKK